MKQKLSIHHIDELLSEDTGSLLGDRMFRDSDLSLQAEDEPSIKSNAPGTPPKPDDLGRLHISTYDLSIEAAGKLNIPVVGLGGGVNSNRRVVVYEWTRFKDFDLPDGGKERWGYAIRFCVTVNKLSANASLALPFLAAEAQLGRIEAFWQMQIIGLQGPKIDASALPPEALNVETFVKARASLAAVVEAVNDSSTKVKPLYLMTIEGEGELSDYSEGAVKTYILAALAKERKSTWVEGRLNGTDKAVALVQEVYSDFGAALGARPDAVAVAKAQKALSGVKVRDV